MVLHTRVRVTCPECGLKVHVEPGERPYCTSCECFFDSEEGSEFDGFTIIEGDVEWD